MQTPAIIKHHPILSIIKHTEHRRVMATICAGGIAMHWCQWYHRENNASATCNPEELSK